MDVAMHVGASFFLHQQKHTFLTLIIKINDKIRIYLKKKIMLTTNSKKKYRRKSDENHERSLLLQKGASVFLFLATLRYQKLHSCFILRHCLKGST